MRSLKIILLLFLCLQFCSSSSFAETPDNSKSTYKKKLAQREIKKWQNGKHNYTSYRSFKPTKEDLENAHVFRHNKNPMVGYIGIPVKFTTNKKHVKGGTHLGTIDSDETNFKEVYIPEDSINTN